MSREEVIRLLGNSWTEVQDYIRRALSSDIGILNNVNASIIGNSGKQLRPILSLLVAGALGRVNEDSIRFAAASELLHNATLLHDDVVDESSTRRGMPTISALMGPKAAVLVGDFWLSKAVEAIVGARHQNEAIPVYSKTLTNLSEGEMLQMEKASAADTTEEDYLRIVYCKTASLFESTCSAAALSVDAPDELIQAAARYGASVGIAFQIKDDIFDYGDPSAIGKPVGSDLKERKITMPLLGALKGSPREAEIRALVASIPNNPGNCELIHAFALENGGLEYASARLGDFVEDALQALEAFPPSPQKEALESFARYNAIRQS